MKTKIPLAALWAGAFIAVFGVTKVMFALQMIFVTTIGGVAVGPIPILLLNIVDLSIGVIAAAAAIFFAARRSWAGTLMRLGWIPLVFYEVGRALGLAAAGMGAIADAKDLIVSVVLLLVLISAGLCASSSASQAYLRQPE